METATADTEIATIATIAAFCRRRQQMSRSPRRLPRRTGARGRLRPSATDPTGDMTKVFGQGSAEWNEGRASQIAPSNTAARAVAQTDFVGIAIHCGAGGGICRRPERQGRSAAR